MWVRGVGNVMAYVALIASIVSVSLHINLHLKPEFNPKIFKYSIMIAVSDPNQAPSLKRTGK
jgi:hypothetical protein